MSKFNLPIDPEWAKQFVLGQRVEVRTGIIGEKTLYHGVVKGGEGAHVDVLPDPDDDILGVQRHHVTDVWREPRTPVHVLGGDVNLWSFSIDPGNFSQVLLRQNVNGVGANGHLSISFAGVVALKDIELLRDTLYDVQAFANKLNK